MDYLNEIQKLRNERIAKEQAVEQEKLAKEQALDALDELHQKEIEEALKIFDGHVLSNGDVLEYRLLGHGWVSLTNPKCPEKFVVQAKGCKGKYALLAHDRRCGSMPDSNTLEQLMDAIVIALSKL